tara:strand:+ start:178 stop:807 length:630 start_codon:yes stop_codon:yes gene_type:complete
MNYEEINVKQVYNNIAEHFNVTRVNQWTWITDFINKVKINNPNKYPKIIDLGCGNGRNMNYNNVEFIGVDNCKRFIEICREKGYNVICSNMTKIPLYQQHYDAIICIASFHHLDNHNNRILALLEMKRLLKIGGEILLSVWSINQPAKTKRVFNEYGDNIVLWTKYNRVFERYYYIFRLEELEMLFKTVGLTIVNHTYDCGNEIYRLKV